MYKYLNIFVFLSLVSFAFRACSMIDEESLGLMKKVKKSGIVSMTLSSITERGKKKDRDVYGVWDGVIFSDEPSLDRSRGDVRAEASASGGDDAFSVVRDEIARLADLDAERVVVVDTEATVSLVGDDSEVSPADPKALLEERARAFEERRVAMRDLFHERGGGDLVIKRKKTKIRKRRCSDVRYPVPVPGTYLMKSTIEKIGRTSHRIPCGQIVACKVGLGRFIYAEVKGIYGGGVKLEYTLKISRSGEVSVFRQDEVYKIYKCKVHPSHRK